MGSFVKDVGFSASNRRFESCLPLACFCGKKSVKCKSVSWQATRDQSGDCGIRAGNRKNVDPGSNRRCGDLSAWVGDSWRPGIADNGDSRARLQLCDQLLRARALVMHVITDGRRRNLEVIQQLLSLTCVLAGDA